MALTDHLDTPADVATVPAELAAALDRLHGRRTAWARLPTKDKARYLSDVQQRTLKYDDRWVQAGAAAKGLERGSPLIGAEEWIGGPYPVVAWITASLQTLHALDMRSRPARRAATHRAATIHTPSIPNWI